MQLCFRLTESDRTSEANTKLHPLADPFGLCHALHLGNMTSEQNWLNVELLGGGRGRESLIAANETKSMEFRSLLF